MKHMLRSSYPQSYPHQTQRIAVEYMSELINYGGQQVPRGYAYQLLIQLAEAQGHDNPRLMADRWMQGYELRQKLF